jgi:phosphoribosylanthranilate isomerase
VHVTGTDAFDRTVDYAAVADALVFDSRTADRLGGTGLTHDCSIGRRLVAAASALPVYLAGRLRLENVKQAIAQVHPAGADINSGVEAPDGRKDRARMRAFVLRAKVALEPNCITT